MHGNAEVFRRVADRETTAQTRGQAPFGGREAEYLAQDALLDSQIGIADENEREMIGADHNAEGRCERGRNCARVEDEAVTAPVRSTLAEGDGRDAHAGDARRRSDRARPGLAGRPVQNGFARAFLQMWNEGREPLARMRDDRAGRRQQDRIPLHGLAHALQAFLAEAFSEGGRALHMRAQASGGKDAAGSAWRQTLHRRQDFRPPVGLRRERVERVDQVETRIAATNAQFLIHRRLRHPQPDGAYTAD